MRPIKEICKNLSLNNKLVMRYAWDMRKIIVNHKRFSSQDYLRKYATKLVHNPKILKKTEKLLRKIKKDMGGNPISLAAGALYYILKKTGKNISKVEIGKTFHISDRTVYCNERKIHKLLQTKGISIIE
jgi:transcription initiation factor TFIIIB Brf1 subunit/transcription initiation factor TFIIB